MRLRFVLLMLSLLVLTACSLSLPQQVGRATAEPTEEAAPAPSATALTRATPAKATRPALAPTRTPAAAQAASYEVADCAFELPDGFAPECGYLLVPEDRADPQSQTIRLHVAVFTSTGSDPQPDPVVYLDGGPGGNPLETVRYVFEDWFGQMVKERDVIIFDQRGTGFSEPALDCAELRDLGYELLDDNLERAEYQRRSLEALRACRERLVGDGVNLSAYTSAENAADLNDLRVALGYDEWNLYGISYGTRLALTALRDTPEGIRSVILDSTYPPQVSETELPANGQRAFDLLFDTCANDAACNRAFPDLRQAFFATVDRLEREPVTVSTVDPFTGQSYDVLLDGESLISTLFQMMYQTSLIPEVPQIIYDAYEERSYEKLADEAAFNLFADDFFSTGMYYSVQCAEEVAFSTREEMAAASDAFPDLRDSIVDEAIVDSCAAWDVRPAPAQENEPVRSDTPVLILAGEFDPITPPSFGQRAAQTLPNSFFFTFPGIGHGASVDHPCPQGITLAFLDEPTAQPDDSCIGRMVGVRFETRR